MLELTLASSRYRRVHFDATQDPDEASQAPVLGQRVLLGDVGPQGQGVRRQQEEAGEANPSKVCFWHLFSRDQLLKTLPGIAI